MDTNDNKNTTEYYLRRIEKIISSETNSRVLEVLSEVLKIIANREEKVSSADDNLEFVSCGRFKVLQPVAGLCLSEIIRMVEDKIEDDLEPKHEE